MIYRIYLYHIFQVCIKICASSQKKTYQKEGMLHTKERSRYIEAMASNIVALRQLIFLIRQHANHKNFPTPETRKHSPPNLEKEENHGL